MKRIFIFLSIIALCGCKDDKSSPAAKPLTGAVKAATTKAEPDFFMRDPVAIEKAKSGVPPPGWSVVCDGAGHFAPAKNGMAFELAEGALPSRGTTVRTNFEEALIVAWRIRLVVDGAESDRARKSPFVITRNWKECP